jgi:imidazolonepropionase-like amidohydrolase
MSVRARVRWCVGLALVGCATSPPGSGASSEVSGAASSGEASGGSTGSTGAPTGEASGSTSAPTGEAGSLLLAGGTVVGLGLADVRVADGEVSAVGDLTPLAGEVVVDVTGNWLAPAFVDSHVHLMYLPRAAEMAAGGVAGVVDLAAPVAIFETSLAPLRAVAAGPMITAVQGYPTQSWGSGGYGRECADAAAAVAAVDQLHALGAGVIKLPITGAPQLDDAALKAATDRAHELGLPVVSHALGDDQARRAALAGVDVLAHTPTEPLSPATVKAWSGRAVISTLRAFGGSQATLANLKALRDAGATVLYGTDFGNTSTPGIDPGELMLMQQAGLTPREIVASGTSAAATRWRGLGALGGIEVGKDASLLVLAGDPLSDPTILAAPTSVYIRGVAQ